MAPLPTALGMTADVQPLDEQISLLCFVQNSRILVKKSRYKKRCNGALN